MSRKSLWSRLKPDASRRRLIEFARAAGQSLAPGALVLDAGSGKAPYRQLFSHAAYETADFLQVDKGYGQVTYTCDLRSIPVESDRFDLVFCSQTLEHVPEPKAVLAEFLRVLKPGGKLWLTAPFTYEEHETPYDFYRYSSYGLRHLLETTGYAIERIEWLEGYLGTLSHQLSRAYKWAPLRPRHYGGGIIGWIAVAFSLLVRPVFALSAIVYARLELRHAYTGAGQCVNYLVVASRPPTA